MVEISASILNVKKEEAIKIFYDLEAAQIDYFHIDIMDGEFVKNNNKDLMKEYLTIIKNISNIPLDIHLMVKEIESAIDEYIPFDPNIITFHYEELEKTQIKKIIQYIKDNNIKVGIAIKPDTNIAEIYEILPYIHMILIMTVEPGKGGQKLIPETIEKIGGIKEYIQKHKLEIDIQADGGITKENINKLQEKGIDIAVVGSALINSKEYSRTVKELKN